MILNNVLGKFYFLEHNRLPPTFIQIVGWTKRAEEGDVKRRYVYVRKVPLIIERGRNSGTWAFDYDLIKRYKYEILQPIHKNCGIVDGNAILIDEAFLRFNGMTLRQRVFAFAKPVTCLESDDDDSMSESTSW